MTTDRDQLLRLARGNVAPIGSAPSARRKANRTDLLRLALGRDLPPDVNPGDLPEPPAA